MNGVLNHNQTVELFSNKKNSTTIKLTIVGLNKCTSLESHLVECVYNCQRTSEQVKYSLF